MQDPVPIAHGADVNAKVHGGKTPLALAKGSGNGQVAELLVGEGGVREGSNRLYSEVSRNVAWEL
jgi:ankyrin repeat protein